MITRRCDTINLSITQLQYFNENLIFLFTSIFCVTFHHHKDGMNHADCPICDILLNNRFFLTHDTYEVFSNYYAIYPVFIYKDLITSYTFTHKFFARSPPA